MEMGNKHVLLLTLLGNAISPSKAEEFALYSIIGIIVQLITLIAG
ncbi:hypothetical protein [Saccharolobus islandicus]|nr:hypothetical protein [Sulfolobus islandicus]